MLYDLSNVLFAVGVVLVLIGMVCVALTGTGPPEWRSVLGRIGAICLCSGLVCVGYVFILTPPGPDYTWYAH